MRPALSLRFVSRKLLSMIKLLPLRPFAHTVLTGGSVEVLSPESVPESQQTRASLTGLTVLVTGASSGIGHASALALAQGGARVVLVARRIEKLYALENEIARAGGWARSYAADLGSAPSTQTFLQNLADDGIEVDVLVNNAGRSIRRAVEHSYERFHDYERTMALNYFGSLRLILGLLPGMRARKRGHIINISSIGVQMGTPMFSAYVASKAALDAFTRVVAGETRSDCVRFTTVHMPLVRTPMIEPTTEYRDLPALTPEQAADLVMHAIVTAEAQLGTPFARWFNLFHVLAPEAVERVVNYSYRLLAA